MAITVTPVHTERVLPRSHTQNTTNTEQSKLLSLLDATSANFSATGAVWFLDRPSDDKSTPADIIKRLRDALITTLDAYPQWCGHLKTLPYRPDEGTTHIQRFGRLQLSYGSPRDPGVELVTAASTATLDDLVPDIKRNIPFRDMHEIPWDSFVPPTELAAPLWDDEETIKPSVAIQLTTLA